MPEIHDQIFKLLEIKVDCLLPEEKHAVLMIDEMAIKPGLQFDNSSGEVIGMIITQILFLIISHNK